MPEQRFTRTIPTGDTHERDVCEHCGFVNYENPRLVVGSVVAVGEEVMLCRRAIEPRRGFWTLPAGFLEKHEMPADGAKREALEEACAEIETIDLLAVYSVPRLSQVQLIYRARLARDGFAPGPESLEVALFAWEAIPWDELAFPSVRWALGHHRAALGRPVIAPFTNPPGEFGNVAR